MWRGTLRVKNPLSSSIALTSLILGFIILTSSPTKAASFVFDFNGFYFSDTFQTTSSASQTRTLIDASFGFTLDKRAKWQIGWNYSSLGASSADETYASSEMGPKVSYYFGKDRNWGMSVAYNLIVTATYTPSGSSAQNWRGSSIRADFGYGAPITESMRLGLRLVYNQATFKEEVDTTTLTQVSYSRSFIYPAIHYSWLY